MADKPILFSGPMVRALLEGRKTQTRRLMKPWPGEQTKWLTADALTGCPTCYLAEINGNMGAQFQHPFAGKTFQGVYNDPMSPFTWVRFPIQSGDRLWVREGWCGCKQMNAIPPRDFSKGEPIGYLADGEIRSRGCLMVAQGRTRASMHMPRWASRLTLVVTDVRVKRLQDISSRDCLAEGVQANQDILKGISGAHSEKHRCDEYHRAHVEPFRTLWDSINGPEAWDANPWVAAYSFTVHKCNIDQMEGAG